MSMDEIERGFRIIGNALEKGKFTKSQLEFIGQFCDSIKGSTNKVLARIAAQNSADSRAGEHISQHGQPKMRCSALGLMGDCPSRTDEGLCNADSCLWQHAARICPECGDTGQNDPPPGKYHGLCHTCGGTGKRGECL